MATIKAPLRQKMDLSNFDKPLKFMKKDNRKRPKALIIISIMARERRSYGDYAIENYSEKPIRVTIEQI